MRFVIMSDLHLECHRDGGEEFFKRLRPDNVDGIILAGDILNLRDKEHVKTTFERFGEMYGTVVYTPGNHEYYGTTPAKGQAVLRSLRKTGIWVLDEDARAVTIGHQRFVGGTGWFPCTTFSVHPANQQRLGDYIHIRDIAAFPFEQNERLRAYLLDNLRSDDVLILHHLAHNNSIAPSYKNDAFNAFFLTGFDSIVEDVSPKLIVHGHTHTKMVWSAGGTTCVTNPLGYPGEESQERFDQNQNIEL